MLLFPSRSLINSSAVSADSAHGLHILGPIYNSSVIDPQTSGSPETQWGKHVSGGKGQVVESEVLVYIGDDWSRSNTSILGPSHFHSAVFFIGKIRTLF